MKKTKIVRLRAQTSQEIDDLVKTMNERRLKDFKNSYELRRQKIKDVQAIDELKFGEAYNFLKSHSLLSPEDKPREVMILKLTKKEENMLKEDGYNYIISIRDDAGVYLIDGV